MIDLEPKYLSLIKKILLGQIPDKTVWVYGSRIKGTAHEGSDLDLLVIDDKEEISPKQLSALREKFTESNLPILIDIMSWSTIPEEFKKEIKQTHEILQSARCDV
jgi:predicted nucleotidyltransferase